MKNLIKFTIALVLGIVTLGFQSCGSDEDEPQAPTNFNKGESIIGEWSCQYELKNGEEVSCDKFTLNFQADGTVIAHYAFAYTRSGSYTFNNGTVTCTFKNSILESSATVKMIFSDYNKGRAKVETTIDYGGSLSQTNHTYLFYKLN